MSTPALPVPVRSFKADQLPVHVFGSQEDVALYMTLSVRGILSEAIARNGSAAAILATGNSQIRFLRHLVDLGGVDWSKVTLFHMDEYLGVPADHPACFRRYMKERVESLLHPRAFHYLGGDALLPFDECDQIGRAHV